MSEIDSSICSFERFIVDDVKESLKHTSGKSCGTTCGIDNIYGEHLKYAHPRLHVHLILLFNAIIIHGHIPNERMGIIIFYLVL